MSEHGYAAFERESVVCDLESAQSSLDVRRSVGGGNKGNERQREAAGKAKLSLVRNYVSIKRRICFYLCPLKQQHLVVLLYRDRLKSVHQV